MLQIDLTTLRPQELRQLLDTTRQRGQAELTYEILQEMAARRERDEREGRRALFARRKRSEPRTIELNLGDPLEIEDEPPPEEDNWDPPHAAEPEPEPEPEPNEAIYLEREPPPQRAPKKAKPRKAAREPRPAPERRPRRWGWAAMALVFGLVAGSVLGWSFDEIAHDLGLAPTTATEKAPTAAPTVVAQALPPAEPAAPTTAADDPSAIQPQAAAPRPDAANAPASQTADATPDSAAAPPPPAAPPVPDPVRDFPPPAETAKADASNADTGKADLGKTDAAKTASAGSKRCAAEPSPADQTICRDPHLQRLQRDLRDAYATALAAHEDRALLREHQLAWADARNAVTDPDKLTQLYEDRIRKLNAATADALRQK
ncbi:MAG TPA: hypothetical protein VFE18_04925 [Phenylobacterium sp.]|uniref:hypothetical protein n=1 Tax=Phenylobacterium sp. TaxID=1871053 RepID=UPI002D585988|nr:hypothetical protein [Phenylobacterium sp.]HZZ67497.1 hypothetical protein [Phenylobacterium sp.]